MINISRTTLLQLPGLQQLLKTLVDDLADEHSLLVLLPMGIDITEIWGLLRAELWHLDFSIEEIRLKDLPPQTLPAIALGDALNINWGDTNTPRTTAQLVVADNLPDVIYLDGFEQLIEEERKEWLTFFSQWVQMNEDLIESDYAHRLTSLCLISPAISVLPDLPKSSLYLALHWWWRFPSMLEIHLLCRLINQSAEWGAKSRWRECLLPTLSGGDISLVEYLWDELHVEVDDLLEHLKTYAQTRNWDKESLQSWGAERFMVTIKQKDDIQLHAPPPQWYTLWAQGALAWTLEYGLELHIAALAALGYDEEVKHRMWRGQAELLLPLVDRTRLAICSHLTRIHGPDWPIRWHRPDSNEEYEQVKANPLACEWGYLIWLLRNCDELQGRRRWIHVATVAQAVRNYIAHYQPISFEQFEKFWDEIKRSNVMVVL